MISVLTWCYSRQKYLDHTLPRWLAQRDVDFEVVVGCGPGIVLPDDPRVVRVETPTLGLPSAYNAMFSRSKGDLICITQSDIEVNDAYLLKRLSDMWTPSKVITDRVVMDGKREPGIYLYLTMVGRKPLEEVGGWDPMWEDYCCGEDSDIMASLLEKGHILEITETPEDRACYHMHHPKPDYTQEPRKSQIAAAKVLFAKKHPIGVPALYAKQFARMMTEKTRALYA